MQVDLEFLLSCEFLIVRKQHTVKAWMDSAGRLRDFDPSSAI